MAEMEYAMRLFAALFLAWAAIAAPAVAQQPRNAAIETVITSQLDAFNGNDGASAFSQASPMIQGMFRDPGTFLGMVQSGYPQIYRSRSAKFLKLGTVNGRLVQTVLIEGADGAFVTAAYEMIEIDGAWRINGVSLIKGEDV
jgi:Domain of unknown function (DUF4864)